MEIKTTLFSVDTLHVQVPAEIDSDEFNERVAHYSEGNEYNGIEDANGGLMVSAKDVSYNLAGYDNPLLVEFFAAVKAALGDADQVYFHR